MQLFYKRMRDYDMKRWTQGVARFVDFNLSATSKNSKRHPFETPHEYYCKVCWIWLKDRIFEIFSVI